MKNFFLSNTNILFLLLLAMCFLFVACNNSSVVDNSEIPTTSVSTTATDTTTKTPTTTADSKTITDKSEQLTTTTKITIAPTTKPTSPPKTEKKTTTKPTTVKPTAKPTKAPTKATTKAPQRTWKYESAMSSELFTLVNNYRVSQGVTALKHDNKCTSGAKKRAEYNATNQIMASHELSQIGAGGGLKNATEIINGWKNSAGHNRSLLRTTEINGGCAIYSDSNGWLYAIFQFDDGGNWS